MSKSVRVPHLGGIDVSYRIAKPFKQSKPSIVLITGMTWGAEVYAPQLSDESISDAANVIAIDALGSGKTIPKATDTWTYWDSALAVLQAIDALGVRKAFLIGAGSGAWVAARAALYSPDVILGLIFVGTTLDSDNERAFKRGNINGFDMHSKIFDQTSTASDNYTPPEDYSTKLVHLNLGSGASEEVKQKWAEAVESSYSGDAGRKRLRQSYINLRERDSLHSRLSDIKAPVLWLQGDQDNVFPVQNAQEEIKLLTRSLDAKLEVISGGSHLLTVSNTAEFNKILAAFAAKYSDKPDARKLREAIGMVDI